MPAESIRIHGLLRGDLAQAPPLTDALPELLRWLSGRVLVVHVAAIDTARLAAYLRRQERFIRGYTATKAYNLLLAEGLWEELRTSGIDVLACCASATSTPNYLASASAASSGVRARAMRPEAVAAETLAAQGRQPAIIPGPLNRLASFVMRRLLPRRAAIRPMGRTLRGMHG